MRSLNCVPEDVSYGWLCTYSALFSLYERLQKYLKGASKPTDGEVIPHTRSIWWFRFHLKVNLRWSVSHAPCLGLYLWNAWGELLIVERVCGKGLARCENRKEGQLIQSAATSSTTKESSSDLNIVLLSWGVGGESLGRGRYLITAVKSCTSMRYRLLSCLLHLDDNMAPV